MSGVSGRCSGLISAVQIVPHLAMRGFTERVAPGFSPERFGETARALDAVISASDEGLAPAVKRGGALTYAKDGDMHHWICAVAVTKKWVSLRFHFGGLLSDPDNVDDELVTRYVR